MNSLLPTQYRQRDIPRTIVKSQQSVRHMIAGVSREVAIPVTLTPFASVKACTARCHFCSEALIYKHSTELSASLRPGANYGKQFRSVLGELVGLEVGLSLSGLEATAEAEWLLDVLQAAGDHLANGGTFAEKILYSNGTGLTPNKQLSTELLNSLQSIGLTRIEMSRHSPNEIANNGIMRFRENVLVAANGEFEKAVRFAHGFVPVKMVCVIQKAGVETIEGVEQYLEWAHRLGIDTVVFRELSRLHDLYKPNVTSKYVEAARVPIEPLVDAAFLDAKSFEALEVTEGYYYWNLHFRWKRKVTAIFETSDYLLMKQLHKTDVVYKMVFHANGKLCADWDPNTHVLMTT